MTHPDHVENWSGSLDELAAAISKMRYDKQAQLLGLLVTEIGKQAESDLTAGRRQLSARLECVAYDLMAAHQGMQAAWKICIPFMKDELP